MKRPILLTTAFTMMAFVSVCGIQFVSYMRAVESARYAALANIH